MATGLKIFDDFAGDEYYVDYYNGSDSVGLSEGLTAGNAFQTIKYAVETGMPHYGLNTTNGVRFNLLNNATHVVSSEIDTTSLSGRTAYVARVQFVGCTSTANDGGYATISVASSTKLMDTGEDSLDFGFLDISGDNNGVILNIDRYSWLREVRVVNNSTGGSAYCLNTGSGTSLANCHLETYTSGSARTQASNVEIMHNCVVINRGAGGASQKVSYAIGSLFIQLGSSPNQTLLSESSNVINCGLLFAGTPTAQYAMSVGQNARLVCGNYIQGAYNGINLGSNCLAEVFGNSHYGIINTHIDSTDTNIYRTPQREALYTQTSALYPNVSSGDYTLTGTPDYDRVVGNVGWNGATAVTTDYQNVIGLSRALPSGGSGSSSSSGSKWTDMTQLTGLVAWYKPETLASTYSNGDSISTWSDSSGNSRDLTGSGTTRPLAAANAFGTYMAADFDGTDDILSTASYQQAPNPCYSIVFEMDVLKNYNGPITIMNQNPPAWYTGVGNLSWVTTLIHSNGKIQVNRFKDTNNAYDVSLDGSASATTKYIMTIAYTEIAWDMRLNGSEVTGGATSGTPSFSFPSLDTAYIHLGHGGHSSSPFNGKIVEAVVYDAVDIDNANSIWVEGYLADKYGITLADGHLFKNAAPQNSPTTYNATSSGGSSYTNVAAAKFTRLE